MLLYTGNHNYMKRKFLSKGYKSFCPDRKGFTFIITIQRLIARIKSSSKYIVNVTFYHFLYCFDWSHKSRFETNNSDSYSMKKLVRLFFVLPFAIAFM